MNDLVIELVLVAMIVVPAVADTLKPAKAIPNSRPDLCRKRRRDA
jgi:hypothetical protein